MQQVLHTLINASERAAAVARSCCLESTEGALLVAEKGAGEANARFDRDYKTIADVLAQEAAKYEICSHYPELSNHVRGEECPEIGGIRISLQKNYVETGQLLSSALPSDTAMRMAKAAHSVVSKDNTAPRDLPDIDSSTLAVWIDPIDATAEFISGVCGKANDGEGLPCVTVLIGAYSRTTGEPIMGVVNQPFYNNGQGRITWGISFGGLKRFEGDVQEVDNKTILMSSAENPEIVEKFKNAGWNVMSVPGAGNKLLKVALGEAAAYIVTKGTTFLWDTCGPHSLLQAAGGGIITYKTKSPITYNVPDNAETIKFANSDGIIAYRSEYILQKVLDIIDSFDTSS